MGSSLPPPPPHLVSRNLLSIRNVLSSFYLLIFYFEKFSPWVWRLPFGLYVKLKLSMSNWNTFKNVSVYEHILRWIRQLSLQRLERFHWRGQQLHNFIGTKESFYTEKTFNFHNTILGHQHGRRFIVLGHQNGRCDVMWKRFINLRRVNICHCLKFS